MTDLIMINRFYTIIAFCSKINLVKKFHLFFQTNFLCFQLIELAKSGMIQKVRNILLRGADKNYQDEVRSWIVWSVFFHLFFFSISLKQNGDSALMHACKNNRPHIVKVLLYEVWADVDLPNNVYLSYMVIFTKLKLIVWGHSFLDFMLFGEKADLGNLDASWCQPTYQKSG